MNRIEIKGIIPPIITPMHADESINTAELRRQVSEVRGKIKALGNVNVSAIEEYAEVSQRYEFLRAQVDDVETSKAELQKLLFTEKRVPEFGTAVDHISLEDGCKVYFKDGSWVICRFSGTEPLLRMAAEADEQAVADGYIKAFRDMLEL